MNDESTFNDLKTVIGAGVFGILAFLYLLASDYYRRMVIAVTVTDYLLELGKQILLWGLLGLVYIGFNRVVSGIGVWNNLREEERLKKFIETELEKEEEQQGMCELKKSLKAKHSKT